MNVVPYSYELSRLIQQHRFAQYTQKQAFDLYHAPNVLPLPFDGPTVITVHDLSWIRYPQAHPPERVRAMNKYFQPGLERASLILTDSEFVKRELMEVFGVKPERIRPVLLGVEALFQPRSADQTRGVLDAHGLVHASTCWPWARWSPERTWRWPCAPSCNWRPRLESASRWCWWA